MFFVLSKILNFLSSPVSWIWILLILAIFWKNPKLKKRFLIAAFAVFYFFSNSFIVDEVLRAWEVESQDMDKVEHHDIAIVLGGFITYSESSQMEGFFESSDRFLHAISLYKAKKVDKILISGGSGSILKPEQKEAVIIKNFMVKIGIPADDIIIETLSRNTHENAKYSAEILERFYPEGNYLLITSAYHMKRSHLCFEKQGVEVTPFPVDHYAGRRKFVFDHLFIPNTYTFHLWDYILHEWIGIATYKILGYA